MPTDSEKKPQPSGLRDRRDALSYLSKKERLRRALWRQPVDRLPVQSNYTGAMAAKLAAHFQCSVQELPARLDNQLLRLEVTHPQRVSAEGRIGYDWWGAGWDTQTEGYWHAFAPLAADSDLEKFTWPDPCDPHLLDDAERVLAADNGEHFAAPNFGMCLFERAWSLRGFDTLLMDLVDQPAWVEALLERITEIQIALAKRFLALGRQDAGQCQLGGGQGVPCSQTSERDLARCGQDGRAPGGVDGGYFGDDYGAQRGMLFSPRIWRALFKPRLARLFAVFRDAGLPVILHSDGDIWPILPDLVDIGLTALNPVQPEVMNHQRLFREWGRHLAFYGGISTQTVLPSGTPEQVRQATRACVLDLAPGGTGLLLGPSHRMQSDIPVENVAAMLQTFPKDRT